MADERLGFVGIVVEDRTSVPAVNEILSSFSPIIRGRMGVPDPQGGEAVIGLIVRGTNDQLGALTGRLAACRRARQERPHLRQIHASPTEKKGMTRYEKVLAGPDGPCHGTDAALSVVAVAENPSPAWPPSRTYGHGHGQNDERCAGRL